MLKSSRLTNAPYVSQEITAFRHAVTAWRKKNGLVRTEVVKGIGISPQQLCHIENGTGNPSLEVFLALRLAMGLPSLFLPGPSTRPTASPDKP